MANVYDKISELQEKLDPESCAFEIGEQLKDICRRDPACEAIRSLVSRQIYLMYERFDIEPV